MTINDCEAILSEVLNHSGKLPTGLRAKVEILIGSERKHARKKRGSADIANFGAADSLFVTFSPIDAAAAVAAPPPVETAGPVAVPIEDLLHGLNKAEQNPDHAFVALKWFRDTFLPKCGYEWAQDSAQRHHWLREAINRRWITTDRLANPRNPEFPTTAIRLNRAAPEVSRMLGQGEDAGFGWTPVAIAGEPMSATVLSGRG